MKYKMTIAGVSVAVLLGTWLTVSANADETTATPTPTETAVPVVATPTATPTTSPIPSATPTTEVVSDATQAEDKDWPADLPPVDPNPNPYWTEFWSHDQINPYSPEELVHEPNQYDLMPQPSWTRRQTEVWWASRIKNCKTLQDRDQLRDCMWRPWNFGW